MSLAVFQSVGPLELLIVLGIVLVIFGPKRLPGLGRQLGAGMREFKDSITRKEDDDDENGVESRSAVPTRRPPRSPPRTGSSPRSASRPPHMATTLRPIRPEDRLSLVEHLDELRKRLILSVVVFLAAFGVCLWQGDVVLDIVNRPLEKTAFKNDEKSTKDPFERTAAFQAQLRRSAIASAATFESLAAATEDSASKKAYEELAAQNRILARS